jgi:hypothetical protein
LRCLLSVLLLAVSVTARRRPRNVPMWTEPLMVLAWRLEYALPNATLDVVEAMASLQQSKRDSVSTVVVSAARGAQHLLQPGRLQPAARLRAVTREACGWGQACGRLIVTPLASLLLS